MAKRFHHKTGTMVTLTNGEKTACRNNPYQEFNNGLVMSSEPLLDDQIFEVRIDKQVRYLLSNIRGFYQTIIFIICCLFFRCCATFRLCLSKRIFF